MKSRKATLAHCYTQVILTTFRKGIIYVPIGWNVRLTEIIYFGAEYTSKSYRQLTVLHVRKFGCLYVRHSRCAVSLPATNFNVNVTWRSREVLWYTWRTFSCMYVRMYACIYIYIYIYIYTFLCMIECISACMCTCMYAYMFVCMHDWMYFYSHACMTHISL
jgi:hypothetical protein